jgi:hypothetical protein
VRKRQLSKKHGCATFDLHQRRIKGHGLLLWAEGVKWIDIHTRVCVQYEDVAGKPLYMRLIRATSVTYISKAHISKLKTDGKN